VAPSPSGRPNFRSFVNPNRSLNVYNKGLAAS
jgi:hypothetical protein